MNRDTIGENIRLLLGIRGLAQEELGRRLGTSQAYIGQLLTTPHPKLSEAATARIAEALGVPVEWLNDPGLASRSVAELRGT